MTQGTDGTLTQLERRGQLMRKGEMPSKTVAGEGGEGRPSKIALAMETSQPGTFVTAGSQSYKSLYNRKLMNKIDEYNTKNTSTNTKVLLSFVVDET